MRSIEHGHTDLDLTAAAHTPHDLPRIGESRRLIRFVRSRLGTTR